MTWEVTYTRIWWWVDVVVMALVTIIVIPWNSSGQNEFLSVSVFGSLICSRIVGCVTSNSHLRKKNFSLWLKRWGGSGWWVIWVQRTLLLVVTLLLPIKLYQITLYLKPDSERKFKGWEHFWAKIFLFFLFYKLAKTLKRELCVGLWVSNIC